MMHRRTATKVRDGRVQHKNRWTRPVNSLGPTGVVIERARPGTGYVHVVTQDELYSFVQQLEDWSTLSVGLDRIILDCGRSDYFGYYRGGTIGLRAFAADLKVTYRFESLLKDREFFERLARDLEFEANPEDPEQISQVHIHLTKAAARAFMLTHVLPHELGHHLDRMSHHLRDCPGGEPFADRYEWKQAPRFWNTYLKVFGDPSRER